MEDVHAQPPDADIGARVPAKRVVGTSADDAVVSVPDEVRGVRVAEASRAGANRHESDRGADSGLEIVGRYPSRAAPGLARWNDGRRRQRYTSGEDDDR